ncbi:MAG TPA: hypothetical protein VGC56_14765 [Allosphingosinicella sp.]|jgi:hypothetical protein
MLLLLGLAPAPDARLPAPIEAKAGDIVLAPSASVRAATIAPLARPPERPMTVKLACEVHANGEPIRCVRAESLGGLARWSDFYAAADSLARSLYEPGGDLIVRGAYERVHALRVRAWKSRDFAGKAFMLFSEVIAAGDAAPPPQPAETVSAESLVFEDSPAGLDMDQLYPEAALRNEVQPHVTITCRVQPSRELLCRDGEVAWFQPLDGAATRQMLLATYQFAAARKVAPLTRDGRQTVGRDVRIDVHWNLKGI